MIPTDKLQEYKDLENSLGNELSKLTRLKLAFNTENQELMDSIHDNQANLEDMKNGLKELALSEFNLTGEKKLAGGLGIRESVKLDYEANEAVAWCKINMPVAVIQLVDKKQFEAYAKDNDIDGVVVKTKTVTATFPKELII